MSVSLSVRPAPSRYSRSVMFMISATYLPVGIVLISAIMSTFYPVSNPEGAVTEIYIALGVAAGWSLALLLGHMLGRHMTRGLVTSDTGTRRPRRAHFRTQIAGLAAAAMMLILILVASPVASTALGLPGVIVTHAVAAIGSGMAATMAMRRWRWFQGD